MASVWDRMETKYKQDAEKKRAEEKRRAAGTFLPLADDRKKREEEEEERIGKRRKAYEAASSEKERTSPGSGYAGGGFGGGGGDFGGEEEERSEPYRLSGRFADEERRYGEWNTEADALAKQIMSDHTLRRQVYVSGQEMKEYRSGMNVLIGDILQNAGASRQFYIQNKDVYDARYGTGTVDRILQNIETSRQYFTNVQKGLDKEVDFYSRFKDEEDFERNKNSVAREELSKNEEDNDEESFLNSEFFQTMYGAAFLSNTRAI